MSVTITGFDSAAENISKIIETLQNTIKTELEGIANQGFSEIVSNTPVRTGYLKSRWRIDLPGGGAFVMSNDAPYAAFVEFGTGRMEGRNFVTPVYNQMVSQIEGLISKFSA